jgi:hypothetical protein
MHGAVEIVDGDRNPVAGVGSTPVHCAVAHSPRSQVALGNALVFAKLYFARVGMRVPIPEANLRKTFPFPSTTWERGSERVISTVVIFLHEIRIHLMSASLWIARFFSFAGGALFLLGLILWWLLPIHFTLPPYLFSPILAIGYGTYCWKRAERPRIEARE